MDDRGRDRRTVRHGLSDRARRRPLASWLEGEAAAGHSGAQVDMPRGAATGCRGDRRAGKSGAPTSSTTDERSHTRPSAICVDERSTIGRSGKLADETVAVHPLAGSPRATPRISEEVAQRMRALRASMGRSLAAHETSRVEPSTDRRRPRSTRSVPMLSRHARGMPGRPTTGFATSWPRPGGRPAIFARVAEPRPLAGRRHSAEADVGSAHGRGTFNGGRERADRARSARG